MKKTMVSLGAALTLSMAVLAGCQSSTEETTAAETTAAAGTTAAEETTEAEAEESEESQAEETEAAAAASSPLRWWSCWCLLPWEAEGIPTVQSCLW